jgi:Zn-dependent peptidase ImmA (M78 family)
MTDQAFTEAVACNANKGAIEAFGSKFAAKLGYGAGAPLRPIVERLGGRIIYQALDTLGDASILVYGQGNFEIFLPEDTAPVRDRFSIAHELGHYVLHFPLTGQRPMKAYRFGSSRVEWEANWFAAGFLMPADEFKTRFSAGLRPIAQHFGVSMAAAEARAKALGVL